MSPVDNRVRVPACPSGPVICLLVASLFFVAAPVVKCGDASDMPLSLCMRGGFNNEPFWVASSLALTADGKPDHWYLDPGALEEVSWMLSEPEKGGCVRFGVVIDYIEHDHLRDSVEDAVETADTILEGVVVAVLPGLFQGGIPGRLYGVRPLQLIKGEPTSGRLYFFFLRAGLVPLGEKIVCAQDARFPEPAAGSRVLLLSDNRNGPDLEFVDIEQPEDIVVENLDGSVWIAQGLRSGRPELASLPFESIVAEFDAVLAAQLAQP